MNEDDGVVVLNKAFGRMLFGAIVVVLLHAEILRFSPRLLQWVVVVVPTNKDFGVCSVSSLLLSCEMTVIVGGVTALL